MSKDGKGDRMFEILTKYREERMVDEADEEMLDKLVMAKYIEYTLKEGGVVYAKATPTSKELLAGSQKTTL